MFRGKTVRTGIRSTNMLTSLVLVLPVLVFYELGVLFTNTLNGADLLTRQLIQWLGVGGFLWFQAGLVLAMIGATSLLRKRQNFEFKHVVPILLESGIYAIAMGSLIVFVMMELLNIDPRLDTTARDVVTNASFLGRLVIAAGAGFHEELVFRLFLVGGLTFLLEHVAKRKRWIALLWAIAISSCLFAAAHHVGPLGDPLRAGAFVYRLLAGIIFALLYQFRGFAIAVYTHTFYDIYVLVLLH